MSDRDSLLHPARASIRWLLALWAVGLVLRLAWAGFISPTPRAGDEFDYWHRAGLVLKHGELLSDGYRPPAQELWVALWRGTVAPQVSTLRVLLAACGSVLVPTVWWALAPLERPRVQVLGAAAVALHPDLVLYAATLWSEASYAVVLLAFVGSATRAILRPSLRWGTRRGLLLGVAALFRDVGVAVGVTLGAVTACGWLVGRRAWTGPVTVTLVAGFLTVLPWTVYLNRDVEHWADVSPVCRTQGFNLLVGNGLPEAVAAEHPGWHPRKVWWRSADTNVERERLAKAMFRERFAERFPEILWEKPWTETLDVLAPTSFMQRRALNSDPAVLEDPKLRKSKPWAWRVAGRRPPWLRGPERTGLIVILMGANVLTIVFGLASLFAVAWREPAVRLWMVVGFGHLWPVWVAFGTSRFRVPFVPLFLAAVALAWDRKVWRDRAAWPGLVALAFGMAVIWLRWEHSLELAWR